MTDAMWSVVGVSVVGASHVARRTPCQDAHCYRVPGDGALIAAISDGAGSAPRSGEGAWVAVHRAAAVLERAVARRAPGAAGGGGSEHSIDWEGSMAQAFAEARAALDNISVQESTELRAFNCTLTAALVLDERVVVGHIGDGACVARMPTGELISVGKPQKAEYANEAYFLTMRGALDLVEVASVEGAFDAVVLTTDGLIRLALDMSDFTPHAPFFEPLLRFVETAESEEDARRGLTAFLSSDRVSSRTDDDKTLVLALRRRAGEMATRAPDSPDGSGSGAAP